MEDAHASDAWDSGQLPLFRTPKGVLKAHRLHPHLHHQRSREAFASSYRRRRTQEPIVLEDEDDDEDVDDE
jgi:hypothetical protein